MFLSHVAAHCPRIRELVLLGCINVTSASIAELVASCTELEKLHLYKGNINEKDVMAIVNGLPKLRELNVAGAYLVNRGYISKGFMNKVEKVSQGRIDTIFPYFGTL